MKVAAVLFLATWLAVFFPRKNLVNEESPAEPKEKVAYALLSVVGIVLCVLKEWEQFPALAHWMDNTMMLIYRFTGGGPS